MLRNNKGYHMIDANKNGVRFRNADLRDLNVEWIRVKADYTEQQKSVVAEIIGIAGGSLPDPTGSDRI